MSKENLENLLIELVCKYNDQEFDQSLKEVPIVNFRLDSINAVNIVDELEGQLQVELFPTLFWEFDTLSEIADWIIEHKEPAVG